VNYSSGDVQIISGIDANALVGQGVRGLRSLGFIAGM